MSLNRFFLIILVFSASIQAAWYQSGLDLVKQNKKPAAALALATSLYIGWRAWQSRNPKPEVAPKRTMTDDEIKGLFATMYGYRFEQDTEKVITPPVSTVHPVSLSSTPTSSSSTTVVSSPTSPSPVTPITHPSVTTPSSPQPAIVILPFSGSDKERLEKERKDKLDEAEKSKSEKEEREQDEKDKDESVLVDSGSYGPDLASIEVFCDGINSENIKAMASFLNIDISKYDGPLLFQQLILENYQTTTNRIQEYKQFISKNSSERSLKACIELNNVEAKVKGIFRNLGIRGLEIIKQLSAGNSHDIFKKTKEEHLINIVSIVWGLHLLASQKDQNFIEGTFNFEGQAIYDFIVSHPDAYDRSGKTQSSHYHEIDSRKFFGIDIPLELRSTLTLPNNKFHILIGNINHRNYLPSNKKVMFMLKPEKYGTRIPEDIIHHTGEYIETRFTKNDQSHMRKEHLPFEIYVALENLYNAHFTVGTSLLDTIWDLALSNKLTRKFYDTRSQCLKDAERFGIKAIGYHMKRLTGDSSTQQSARKALEELLKGYDHLELRKGREVILTKEEIKRLSERLNAF